jgi:hypothetical protein
VKPSKSIFTSNLYNYMLKCEDSLREFYEVKIFFSIMVLRNIVKKNLANKVVKRIYNQYYDVIYKYSHKKLYKLIELRAFQRVFKHFTETGSLEAMMKEDKTMRNNLDAFKQRTANILNKIGTLN